jgi:hypothetical protein
MGSVAAVVRSMHAQTLQSILIYMNYFLVFFSVQVRARGFMWSCYGPMTEADPLRCVAFGKITHFTFYQSLLCVPLP